MYKICIVKFSYNFHLTNISKDLHTVIIEKSPFLTPTSGEKCDPKPCGLVSCTGFFCNSFLGHTLPWFVSRKKDLVEQAQVHAPSLLFSNGPLIGLILLLKMFPCWVKGITVRAFA